LLSGWQVNLFQNWFPEVRFGNRSDQEFIAQQILIAKLISALLGWILQISSSDNRLAALVREPAIGVEIRDKTVPQVEEFAGTVQSF
jgi:hypothetical protein